MRMYGTEHAIDLLVVYSSERFVSYNSLPPYLAQGRVAVLTFGPLRILPCLLLNGTCLGRQ